MNAARFRWNVKRNVFPLAFLPSDIVLLICGFLSHKDKANLSRINRYFREIFRCPQAWKETTVCFKNTSARKIKDCHLPVLLEVLAARRITFVELAVLDLEVIPYIFKYLPHLEGLSLPKSTSRSVKVLQECVKDDCKLRKIDLGDIQWIGRGNRQGSRLCYLFEKLKFLEDVSFGPVKFNQLLSGNQASCRRMAGVKEEIRSALCVNGNLTSLTINDCDVIELSWIQEILVKNPHIQTLRLCHVRHLTLDPAVHEGADALRPRLTPGLRTLDLTGTVSTDCFFRWFSQHADQITAVTSLNLTNCTNVTALSYLSECSDVQELNLTRSRVSNSVLKKLNLAQLRSLELGACHNISGHGIRYLSALDESTLQYLGLANCQNISSHHLLVLIPKFPHLRSLDLSFCNVTDEILADWYLNSRATGQLRLKKLNLTGCEAVTRAIVDMIRLKTRNHLIVEI